MKTRSASSATTFVLGLGILCTTAAGTSASDAYRVDPVHSAVLFRVNHLGFSYSYGRFNIMSGLFTLDESSPGNSTIEVEIQAASIDTGSPSRDKHLRGPDFFNAKQFPTIRFQSTKVSKSGKKTYKVTGDLTLHGFTKPITVQLEHVGSGTHPRFGARSGFEVVFTIKRSEFGMKTMLGAIGDEIRIILSIEGIRE